MNVYVADNYCSICHCMCITHTVSAALHIATPPINRAVPVQRQQFFSVCLHTNSQRWTGTTVNWSLEAPTESKQASAPVERSTHRPGLWPTTVIAALLCQMHPPRRRQQLDRRAPSSSSSTAPPDTDADDGRRPFRMSHDVLSRCLHHCCRLQIGQGLRRSYSCSCMVANVVAILFTPSNKCRQYMAAKK